MLTELCQGSVLSHLYPVKIIYDPIKQIRLLDIQGVREKMQLRIRNSAERERKANEISD